MMEKFRFRKRDQTVVVDNPNHSGLQEHARQNHHQHETHDHHHHHHRHHHDHLQHHETGSELPPDYSKRDRPRTNWTGVMHDLFGLDSTHTAESTHESTSSGVASDVTSVYPTTPSMSTFKGGDSAGSAGSGKSVGSDRHSQDSGTKSASNSGSPRPDQKGAPPTQKTLRGSRSSPAPPLPAIPTSASNQGGMKDAAPSPTIGGAPPPRYVSPSPQNEYHRMNSYVENSRPGRRSRDARSRLLETGSGQGSSNSGSATTLSNKLMKQQHLHHQQQQQQQQQQPEQRRDGAYSPLVPDPRVVDPSFYNEINHCYVESTREEHSIEPYGGDRYIESHVQETFVHNDRLHFVSSPASPRLVDSRRHNHDTHQNHDSHHNYDTHNLYNHHDYYVRPGYTPPREPKSRYKHQHQSQHHHQPVQLQYHQQHQRQQQHQPFGRQHNSQSHSHSHPNLHSPQAGSYHDISNQQTLPRRPARDRTAAPSPQNYYLNNSNTNSDSNSYSNNNTVSTQGSNNNNNNNSNKNNTNTNHNTNTNTIASHKYHANKQSLIDQLTETAIPNLTTGSNGHQSLLTHAQIHSHPQQADNVRQRNEGWINSEHAHSESQLDYLNKVHSRGSKGGTAAGAAAGSAGSGGGGGGGGDVGTDMNETIGRCVQDFTSPQADSPPIKPSPASKGKRHTSKSCPFDTLPNDILLKIFAHLPTDHLCRCAQVCRPWYNAVWDHPVLWTSVVINKASLDIDRALKYLTRRLSYNTPKVCMILEKININSCCRLTDRGLQTVVKRCPELRYLDMQGCHLITNLGVTEAVSRCVNLERLDVTGCSLVTCISLTESAMSQSASRHLQRIYLRYLDMTDCPHVTDQDLSTITSQCTQLLFFYLRRCPLVTDLGVSCVANNCGSLRELSVSDCRNVTDLGLRELAKLRDNLRYLSVAKCTQVTDEGVIHIAASCSKLRYLNVRGCEAVSDRGLEFLARSCPRLKSLDVGKCDVTDEGLYALSIYCPSLRKLSVKSCDAITDKGIVLVAYRCPALQQLHVQDCCLSSEAYAMVRKYCKRAIIEHTNPGFL